MSPRRCKGFHSIARQPFGLHARDCLWVSIYTCGIHSDGQLKQAGLTIPVWYVQDEGDSPLGALDPAQQLQQAQRESAQQQQARTNSAAGATSGAHVCRDNNIVKLSCGLNIAGVIL